MSTPSSDEPVEGATSAIPPEQSAAAPPPPPPQPSAAPPAAPATAAHPVFAPVQRAPRAPWVNPDRRGQVLAAAIVAALVLLGAGVGIGVAVAPSGDHHRGDHMYGDWRGPGMHGRFLPGDGVFPGPRNRDNFPYPAGPTPTPSGTSTS